MSTTAQTAVPPRSCTRCVLTGLAATAVIFPLITYLGISAFAASVLTTPHRAFSTVKTPATFNLDFQDVRFPARGGDVEIAGWYIPRVASGKAVVLVHGKDSSRANEFQGDFVDFAAALHGRGFAVLMIDLRGHGQSGDAHLSFGLNERRDIIGAVDWLKGQGFQPGSIGVLGISMGGASGIGAAAEDPDIGAVVDDCGYAEIYSIMQQEWHDASGLPDFFLPSSLAMGRLLFGYDLAAARPVDEIGRIAPRPVLIIHGTVDSLIPFNHAERLKAAGPSAELWTIPGAGHDGAYYADPKAYLERVAAFFEEALK